MDLKSPRMLVASNITPRPKSNRFKIPMTVFIFISKAGHTINHAVIGDAGFSPTG